MAAGVIAVFIPIIMFLVFGIIIVVYIFYRSKERQILLEKGLSAEEIKAFFDQKRDPYGMLKIGIISIFFGLGIGIGIALEDMTGKDFWTVLFIFVFTGLGFVIANLVGNKMRAKIKSNER
ncbi:hypothetical protein BMS3Abin03_01053 [bacterium BMS3Abin03]|nr:hypothetical protein BMS3Abin03_01053 [bacterium BMS3Abin03]